MSSGEEGMGGRCVRWVAFVGAGKWVSMKVKMLLM